MRTQRLQLIKAVPDDAGRIVAVIVPSALNNLQFFRSKSRLTLREERTYLKRMCKSGTDYLFLIERREDGALIGSIGLHEHDRFHNTARLGITIWREEDRGKGYATEAIERMLIFGFRALRLNKVYLSFFVENERARKRYTQLGFTQEGILREEYHLEPGMYHDMVRMSILKREQMQRCQKGAHD